MSNDKTTHGANSYQYEINYQNQRAIIMSRGANLRLYQVDEKNIIVPYEQTNLPIAYQGDVLSPWANRLAKGKYTFEGKNYELPTNETKPDGYKIALHGLTLQHDWILVAHKNNSVTLKTNVPKLNGYPFDICVEVTYSLQQDGLHIYQIASNVGSSNAPYATGYHPYFALFDGGEDVTDYALQWGSTSHITMDEHQIPIAKANVSGTNYDYRRPKKLAFGIDDEWMDISESNPTAIITGPKGNQIILTLIKNFNVWQLYTGSNTSKPPIGEYAIAIEPMTAPADIFNSKSFYDKNIVIPSGGKLETEFSIRYKAVN